MPRITIRPWTLWATLWECIGLVSGQREQFIHHDGIATWEDERDKVQSEKVKSCVQSSSGENEIAGSHTARGP